MLLRTSTVNGYDLYVEISFRDISNLNDTKLEETIIINKIVTGEMERNADLLELAHSVHFVETSSFFLINLSNTSILFARHFRPQAGPSIHYDNTPMLYVLEQKYERKNIPL